MKKIWLATRTKSLCLIALMESTSTPEQNVSLHGHIIRTLNILEFSLSKPGLGGVWVNLTPPLPFLPSLNGTRPSRKRGNVTFFIFFSLWKGFNYSQIMIIRSNDVMIPAEISWFLPTLDHAISTRLKFKLVSIVFTMKINLQALMKNTWFLSSSVTNNPLPPKISFVILLTVCYTILLVLLLRIWYWIN